MDDPSSGARSRRQALEVGQAAQAAEVHRVCCFGCFGWDPKGSFKPDIDIDTDIV